ncbi:MAG: PAS domain S-box protein, partial [Holophaga sp.]|nr:PAS domain S-box protein [Holophaga sp.]
MTISASIPVLLVDDRPENLTALEALLGDLGLDLVSVQSGNEALRQSLKTEFALVLLDVQMPDMDGFETAELLRANPKTRRLPIMFVTAGMKDDSYRFKGCDAGAVDYLTKPIEPKELRSKVRVFCDLFLQRKEIERHEQLLETLVEQRTIALRESESSYRAILESAGDYVVRYDRRGAHLYGNAKVLDLTGFSQDQFLGKTHRELGFPEPLCELWEAAIEKVFATRESTTVSFEIQSPSGPLFLELKLAPEKDILGQVASVVGVTRDMTEHQHLEETQAFLAQAQWLGTGEDFFQALARFLAQHLGMDFICIDRLVGNGLAAKTLAVWTDGHFEDNTEYTLKDTPCGDVVGQNICCFPSGVRHQFPNDQVLQDIGAESYLGTTLWGSNGQPIGLIAIIGRHPVANSGSAESTLTMVAMRAAAELERRDSEASRLLSEARLEQAFGASPIGMAIVALDGHFLQVNPALCTMLGRTKAEMLVEGFQTITHPQDL